jgi:2-iminobutanoate/2-iminopropanoate deaminase
MPKGMFLILLFGLFITSCSYSDEENSDSSRPLMEREVIQTDHAPAAIGVYSQAVKVGNTIYVSGQIGLLPETGVIVGESLDAQVRQTICNIEAILQAGGFGLEDVVSAQVFLSDLADYQAFNDIYIEYFEQNPPARMVVEVSRIPRDAKVEIMVTASH